MSEREVRTRTEVSYRAPLPLSPCQARVALKFIFDGLGDFDSSEFEPCVGGRPRPAALTEAESTGLEPRTRKASGTSQDRLRPRREGDGCRTPHAWGWCLSSDLPRRCGPARRLGAPTAACPSEGPRPQHSPLRGPVWAVVPEAHAECGLSEKDAY